MKKKYVEYRAVLSHTVAAAHRWLVSGHLKRSQSKLSVL